MASDPAAARLTQAHRTAQARLGVETALQIRAAWPLLDLEDLDGTTERWLRVTVPIIGAMRTRSARLAANYLTTFRSLELGVSSARFAAVLAEDLDRKAVVTSLTVTGPASVKAGMKRGTGPAQLRQLGQIASARAAGAALRHAMNGGRETIVQTVAADSRALGYARAASSQACHFCAMLASRGPVYSEDTVDFEAHDHCSCSAEPVYSRDAEWPANSDRYRELWEETTAGLSGDEAITAFRDATVR